jgi:hypothetical protein
MKYIKSYKLFESVSKIQFPTYTELHDFFIELEDDEITKFNYNSSAESLSKFIDGGYLFSPQRWDRPIQSQLQERLLKTLKFFKNLVDDDKNVVEI